MLARRKAEPLGRLLCGDVMLLLAGQLATAWTVMVELIFELQTGGWEICKFWKNRNIFPEPYLNYNRKHFLCFI